MSVPLPAEVGDTSSIGFVGYDWPLAVPQTPAASAPLTRAASTRRNFAMLISSFRLLFECDWRVSLPLPSAVNRRTLDAFLQPPPALQAPSSGKRGLQKP